MKAWRHIEIAVLAGFAVAAGAQIKPGAAPSLSYAVSGDAASGEVVSEDSNQLRLNVTPCQSTQTVVVFHKPFAKSASSSAQCNGATKTIVQVLQR